MEEKIKTSQYLKDDKLIAVYKNIYLYKVGYNSLDVFSDFVFQKYAYHYKKKYNWQPEISVKEEMLKSDLDQFKDSSYFAFKGIDDNFLGTIKVSKRGEQQFSIEKDFDLNIDEFIKEQDFKIDNIWHLGRLAIASDKLRLNYPEITSKQIIKELLLVSLSYIAKNPNDLMLAESDVLIHKIFGELGVHMEIIGKQKNFLGSPTYPVMLRASSIRKWLSSNVKHQTQ